MLTFFRRIRKGLLSTGSTGKYLLYAVGEIALVVIGILIALEINNWNQNRLNTIEEQKLLELINTEMENYLWLQEIGTRKQENLIEAVERLLQSMKQKSVNVNRVQFDKDLHTIYSTRWIAGAGTATNVYDVLINGGKFGLLSSQELQQRLGFLKENFTYTRIYDQFQAEFIDHQLSPFLNQYIDRLSVSKDRLPIDSTLFESPFITSYDELLESREFSNLLTELIKHTSPIVSAYSRVNQQIRKIDSITVTENSSLTPLGAEN